MWKTISTAREVSQAGQQHGVLTHSAAMAFFLVFSLPALVVVLVVLAGLLPVGRMLRAADVELVGEITSRLEANLPEESADVVVAFVETYFADAKGAVGGVFEKRAVTKASRKVSSNKKGASWARALRGRQAWVLILAFLFVLWSASGAARAALVAMDQIHGVDERSTALGRAGRSVVLTVGMVFGVLVVLAILPFGNLVAEAVAEERRWKSLPVFVWQAMNWVLGVSLLFGLVTTLHRFGPRATLSFSEVRRGSMVTVTLWILLSLGLKAWTEFGWDSFGATYGGMAGLVVLLLWCYLSSAALLWGVTVNAVSVRRKRRSEKAKGAGWRRLFRRRAA